MDGHDAERASHQESSLTNFTELPAAEREVLAALAIVGHASLSSEELAELAEVEDVKPLVTELERRGLIEHDEKQRYSLLGDIGEKIRQTNDALSTGERLMKYVMTLAKGGQLTPERLLDDSLAVLGLTEWAAERRQWKRLLELVKTLKACYEIARRIEDWLALLNRGLGAARALGDRQSELWFLHQLSTASASVGNHEAAERYLHEAKKLQGWRRAIPRHWARNKKDSSFGGQTAAAGAGATGATASIGVTTSIGAKTGIGATGKVSLWMLGLSAAAIAGGATGYAIGHKDDRVSLGTTQVPVRATVDGKTVTTLKAVALPKTVTTLETIALPGGTVTTPKTVTLPARTVIDTTTDTRTVTVTKTVTETTPPPIREPEG